MTLISLNNDFYISNSSALITLIKIDRATKYLIQKQNHNQ